jgi:hypothetical protein
MLCGYVKVCGLYIGVKKQTPVETYQRDDDRLRPRKISSVFPFSNLFTLFLVLYTVRGFTEPACSFWAVGSYGAQLVFAYSFTFITMIMIVYIIMFAST